MADKKSLKEIINKKMRLFDDFKVCAYNDQEMREKLKEAIEARPDVDPQIVLDSYCRPFIQEAMSKWV